MNRSPETLNAPPRFLLWLVVVFFFLLIVGVLAALSYFGGGQRLGLLIPYAGIALVGVIAAAIGGAVIFRRSLPRLMWLWVTLLAILLIAALAAGSVYAYRNVLPPRYQEQMLTEVPFLRALLPPTPQGGIIPTVQAPTGGISPEDLLAVPLLEATEAAAPTEIPTAEATPETTEQAIQPVIVLAPSATPLPSQTPITPTTLPATAAPTLAATLPSNTPVSAESINTISHPAAQRIYGFTYVKQGWNDCGPANITMALSHYGWRQTQDFAADILKPNPEDKNVSPSEMVAFVRNQTQVSAVTRMGGDMDMVKNFIAANIPIIVETGFSPEGENWYGHYQTVVGYDDAQSVFYIYDSLLGTGTGDTGMPEHYSDFDAHWQPFNRTFIVLYEKDREDVVQQILGDRADVTKADEHALEIARQEATADRQNAFAWFNMGTSYDKLGEYEQAAAAYDHAFQLGSLPFRMLWYQFGPFEAYFETGRYDEVLALVNTNVANAGSYVEETFYWQGKVYAAQGRPQDAAAAFQRALTQNPNYAAARDALGTLNL